MEDNQLHTLENQPYACNGHYPAAATLRFTYPYLPVDPAPRRRDRNGYSIPETWVHRCPPFPNGDPIEATPLFPLTQWLETTQGLPGHAQVIRYTYNHKLLPAGQAATDVRKEEEEQLTNRNTERAERNRELEQEIAGVQTRAAGEIDALKQELAALGPQRLRTQQECAIAVATAGGIYNPHREPDPIHVDHPQETPFLAARLGQVHLELRELLMHPNLVRCATLALGSLLGISIGLMTKSIYGDSLTKTPPLLAFWMIVGMAPALFTRSGVKLLWHRVALLSFERVSGFARAPFTLAALIICMGFVAMDATIEQKGLLANRAMETDTRSLGTHATPQDNGDRWLYLMAAALITLPYVIYCGLEGYYQGKIDAAEHLARSRTRNATPYRLDIATEEGRQALKAVAADDLIQYRVTALRRKLEEATNACHEKVKDLEARREKYETQLPEAALQRIQDGIHNALGAQLIFDATLENALRLTDEGTSILYLPSGTSKALHSRHSWLYVLLYRWRRQRPRKPLPTPES